MPPSMHIGILLNNSYINDMNESHLESTVCLWKFDTEIEIHYIYDFLYPNDTYGPPQGQALGVKNVITLSADIISAYGYKSKLDGDNLVTEDIKLNNWLYNCDLNILNKNAKFRYNYVINKITDNDRVKGHLKTLY